MNGYERLEAKLRAERDEVRRLWCGASWEDPREVAKKLKWDCFKEEAT